MIKIKKIYNKPEKEEGYRILVDRLWPRGLSKNKARIDLWIKKIAPSDKLRKWFSHDPKKWEQFKDRYTIELKQKKNLPARKIIPPHSLATSYKPMRHSTVTLFAKFLGLSTSRPSATAM